MKILEEAVIDLEDEVRLREAYGLKRQEVSRALELAGAKTSPYNPSLV